MPEQKQDEVFRRLESLLVYPREGLEVEMKGWLDLSNEEHRANLAKALLSLANHGGGYVVLGLTESDGQWVPEAGLHDLTSYSQDVVNAVVQKYAEPAFHCIVYQVTNPESGQRHPIVVVPGGQRVPIRCKRDGPNQAHVRMNSYYIRRPGPKSEPPQSGAEWNRLIGRCVRENKEDLMNMLRLLMLGSSLTPEQEAEGHLDNWVGESLQRWDDLLSERLPDESPPRFVHGNWLVAYYVRGTFEKPTLSDMLRILGSVESHESGWPPWWVPNRKEIAPYPYEGVIECWLAEKERRDVSTSDFWRASPDGRLFLLRGYQEDDADTTKPGTILDLTIPIWRVGECLLHAERVSRALAGDESSLLVYFRWTGLSGRVLQSWLNPRRFLPFEKQAQQDTVHSRMPIRAERIRSDLPGVVQAMTRPLYEAFDFTEIPLQVIQEEISRMRGQEQ